MPRIAGTARQSAHRAAPASAGAAPGSRRTETRARRFPRRVSLFLLLLFGAAVFVPHDAAADGAPGIEFGNNRSAGAHDGRCDDPRFAAVGAPDRPPTTHPGETMFRDAADCFGAFREGRVRLRTATGDIDFGDDEGPSPFDHVCDDPRFAFDPRRAPRDSARRDRAGGRGGDKTDCFRAYLAREVWPRHETLGIAFGDDSSEWSNDGECDDPRFEGAGVALFPGRDSVLRDATDCIAAYEAETAFPTTVRSAGPGDDGGALSFGDDSGRWSFDGECDDPRFANVSEADWPSMAPNPSEEYVMRDATDCFRAHERGDIALAESPADGGGDSNKSAVFGDDSGQWPFDGECDDPRFEGAGVVEVPLRESVRRDATDCRAAHATGAASLTVPDIDDYGDDSGRWSFDGECDDPRFENSEDGDGPGVAATLLAAGTKRDATDCFRAVRRGDIRWIEAPDFGGGGQ